MRRLSRPYPSRIWSKIPSKYLFSNTCRKPISRTRKPVLSKNDRVGREYFQNHLAPRIGQSLVEICTRCWGSQCKCARGRNIDPPKQQSLSVNCKSRQFEGQSSDQYLLGTERSTFFTKSKTRSSAAANSVHVSEVTKSAPCSEEDNGKALANVCFKSTEVVELMMPDTRDHLSNTLASDESFKARLCSHEEETNSPSFLSKSNEHPATFLHTKPL